MVIVLQRRLSSFIFHNFLHCVGFLQYSVLLFQKEAATAVAVADAEALERARKAVLDCPMCGKPLKTDAVSNRS